MNNTYSLSFWSVGSIRPRHTSVSLLSLLSWGPDETDKTWVSLFSLGTGVSTQTGQTRRSLQVKEKQKEESEEIEKMKVSDVSMTTRTKKEKTAHNRSRWSFLSCRSRRSLLTLKQKGGVHVMHRVVNNMSHATYCIVYYSGLY